MDQNNIKIYASDIDIVILQSFETQNCMKPNFNINLQLSKNIRRSIDCIANNSIVNFVRK